MPELRNFNYPSSDGSSMISAAMWLPQASPEAILQITHGMSEHKERYDDFARWLADRGILVCANDHAGHGGSVSRDEDLGYIRESRPCGIMKDDMHALRGIIGEKYPGVPYFMLGHSMGSYLLRAYLADRGQGLAGAVIMGTGFTPPEASQAALERLEEQAKQYGWRHLSPFGGGKAGSGAYEGFDITHEDAARSWLTRDVEIVEKYKADPKCGFPFTLAGYKGLFQAVLEACSAEGAGKLPKGLPLLVISGGRDPVGGLGEGVRKACKMYIDAGMEDVTLRIYPDSRHEVLNELDRYDVYEYLYRYIKCHIR